MYEVVLDGKYGGFYEVPLLYNYYKIAKHCTLLGNRERAEEYLSRIFVALEKHLTGGESAEKSKLLYSTSLPNATPTERLCQDLLQSMATCEALAWARDEICGMLDRFCACGGEEEKK